MPNEPLRPAFADDAWIVEHEARFRRRQLGPLDTEVKGRKGDVLCIGRGE